MTDRGILASALRSDGSHRDKLYVDGGPSTTGTVGHLRMEGKEVFRHAVGMITDVIEAAYASTGMGSQDIDWFVPHQANRRIIDASAKKLGIAPEKGRCDRGQARQHLRGIHSARFVRGGTRRPHRRGDIVLLEAMGGGFTWGSVLLRW
jgi:3-oxoacyl-[acyl-carrier-protein] synthase III